MTKDIQQLAQELASNIKTEKDLNEFIAISNGQVHPLSKINNRTYQPWWEDIWDIKLNTFHLRPTALISNQLKNIFSLNIVRSNQIKDV